MDVKAVHKQIRKDGVWDTHLCGRGAMDPYTMSCCKRNWRYVTCGHCIKLRWKYIQGKVGENKKSEEHRDR